MLFLQVLQTARKGHGDFEFFVFQLIVIIGLAVLQRNFHLFDGLDDSIGFIGELALFTGGDQHGILQQPSC